MTQDLSSFKSGFVAVIGRPNVGKSTLINALLGQKVAAVSPRPQTTRRRQLGILTLETAQIIFVDSPGIHKPVHRLGEYMNRIALETLEDADVILWIVDSTEGPTPEDELCARHLQAVNTLPPVILALNKIDLVSADLQERQQTTFLELLPQAIPLRLSALSGQGKAQLLEAIMAHIPQGPPFYEEEQVTDLYEREIAADLIRETALKNLHEEVPHGMAVRIDQYQDRGDDEAHIEATLFVERESHKGIVIGKGGEMIKKLGTGARLEIEKMTGRKIYLELRVKVNKNWRSNPAALKQMGFE